MTSTHPQDQPDTWALLTDEQTVQALLHPVRFVNPCWMAYLERERPAALAAYLQLHVARGGTLGPPARRFLSTGR